MTRKTTENTAASSHVAVKGPCNLSCIFCNPLGVAPEKMQAAGEIRRRVNKVKRDAFDTISFGISRYEPTTHPDLPGAIAFAAEKGFKNILLSTNGIRTADMDYLKTLRDAGLNMLDLTFFSSDRETTDLLTRSKGVLDSKIATLRNSIELGIMIAPKFLLMSFNHTEIPDMARMFLQCMEGARDKTFVIAAFNPVDDFPVSRLLIPHYTSSAEKITEAARKFPDLKFLIYWLPVCVIETPLSLPNTKYVPTDDPLLGETLKGFVKFDRCRTCGRGQSCMGVSGRYIAAYGDREFTGDGNVERVAPPSALDVVLELEKEKKQNAIKLINLSPEMKYFKNNCLNIINSVLQNPVLRDHWKTDAVEALSEHEILVIINGINSDKHIHLNIRVRGKNVPDYKIKTKNHSFRFNLMGRPQEESQRLADVLIAMFSKIDRI